MIEILLSFILVVLIAIFYALFSLLDLVKSRNSSVLETRITGDDLLRLMLTQLLRKYIGR